MFRQNFKIVGGIVPKKSSPNNFIGEKEKWTNKGNDKHEDGDSVLRNMIRHAHSFYTISKSWSGVVPEESLLQNFNGEKKKIWTKRE